ncbi:hypothetical protein M501DRAFT_471518 [Patellaria atrata CBS 101060]|uniref:Uncharacterized protein n=1 Tax=Patellaria atrata CBS 101060 TaxID=1346257 RepID=A0A9P4S2S0_9PEZI|nr:hypothetical protein M501DRAFT_471518 [Patellaria atrata CBS 101060]
MACVACQKPLTLEIEQESEDEDMQMEGVVGSSSSAAQPNTVPDDIELGCGCHFHWQCLLDAYQTPTCPSCSTPLTSPSSPKIPCTLHNEGGLQRNLDILPLLTEESYLRTHPEALKPRAFLTFCASNDVTSILHMLEDESSSTEDAIPLGSPARTALLRSQDPLGDHRSGLHAAVQGGAREVVWLLLLLASELELSRFPQEVLLEADALGVQRESQEGLVDIRRLRDARGRSAEDLAVEVGGVWHGWAGTGRLTI